MPFFGICLGMQMAVVEFARHVCGIEDAYSAEFREDAKNPVIHMMEGQKVVTRKGGTMRLGAYPCELRKGTLARRIYGQEKITERHRHRFEFNNGFRQTTEGIRPDHFRRLSRRGSGGDRRTRRPSVVPRLPVPSRIPFPPHGAASAVRIVRRRLSETARREIVWCGKLPSATPSSEAAGPWS